MGVKRRGWIGVVMVVLGVCWITGCGGDNGNKNKGNLKTTNVTGSWKIHEEIDNRSCGMNGDTDDYSLVIEQNRDNITVTAPSGTFHGTINENKISWTGEFFDPEIPGHIAVTSLSLTVDGDSVSGTAKWDFRETADGPVICSGTTIVTGTRIALVEPTPSSTIPNTPGGVSASALSDSSIRVSWTDHSDNERGFKIQRSQTEANGFSEVGSVSTGVTSYTDKGLLPSTSYFYVIVAYSDAGESTPSNVARTVTLASPVMPPSAPSDLLATTISSDSIRLDWMDHSNNVSGYRVQRGSSQSGPFTEIFSAEADARSYIDTGLVASGTYFYRILGFNSTGESAASNVATATTFAPPATIPSAPSDLIATTISSSSIRLNWKDNADNETGYKVERSISSTGSFLEIASLSAAAKSYDDGGLNPSTTHYYRVRAYNSTGNSIYSNIGTATTSPPPLVPPEAPTALTANLISNSTATLQWADSSTNETGFEVGTCTGLVSSDSNNVMRCVGPFNVVATKSANVTSHVVTGLTSAVEYSYFVRAYNSAGRSANIGTKFTTRAGSQTITFTPQFENFVMSSSTDPTRARTVFRDSGFGVGCNWVYSFVFGIQDYVCTQGLLKFNLSTLVGKTIESALLRLTASSIGVGSFPKPWYVRASASDWSTSTVTWNIIASPGFLYFTGSEIVINPPTRQDQVYNIDVTTIVRNWASETWANNGLIFGSHDFTFPNATSFDSFGFYGRTDLAGPKLSVVYH